MDFGKLEQLGFTMIGSGESADLMAELLTPIANPISRQFIERATFRLRGERLIPTAPPEFAGLPAIPIDGIARLSDFQSRLQTAFDAFVLLLQRRGGELQTLGLHPIVDPESLELSANVDAHGMQIRIAADKLGQFHVTDARRGDTPVRVPTRNEFELSEFRELHALVTFLEALVTEQSPASSAGKPQAAAVASGPVAALALDELAKRFGGRAVIPIRTPVELVADLRVRGENYRFAASRVMARTFRGLLAGPRGKVWSGRFELDEFPGVVSLAAAELKVDEKDIEFVGLAPKA